MPRYLFNGTLLNLIVSKKRSLIKYKSQKLTQKISSEVKKNSRLHSITN